MPKSAGALDKFVSTSALAHCLGAIAHYLGAGARLQPRSANGLRADVSRPRDLIGLLRVLNVNGLGLRGLRLSCVDFIGLSWSRSLLRATVP